MISATRCSAALIALVLVLAACSGSSAKADPTADLALANSALLTKADLPGFASTPHSAADDIPASAKKDFADCLHVSTTVFDDTKGAQKADSPDFDQDQRAASVSIEIDPKKSDIDEGWKQLSQAGVEPCLKALFAAAIKGEGSDPAGVQFAPTSVTRFQPGVGDRSVGYTIKVSANGGGADLTVIVDFILVARDRAGMTFLFSNTGTPFERATEIALAQKVYDRIGDKAS